MKSSKPTPLLVTFLTYPLSLAPLITPLLFLPELPASPYLPDQTFYISFLAVLLLLERSAFSFCFTYGQNPPRLHYYLLTIFLSTLMIAGLISFYGPKVSAGRPWFFLTLLLFLLFALARTLDFSRDSRALILLFLSLSAQGFMPFCAVLNFKSAVDSAYVLLFSCGVSALVVHSLLIEPDGVESSTGDVVLLRHTAISAMIWGLLPLAALIGVGGGRLPPLYLANLLPFLLIQRVLTPKGFANSPRLTGFAGRIGLSEKALMALFAVWFQLFCLTAGALLSYQIAHDTL